MILNRLLRSVRSMDLKYLVVEFILIFLSISLSLYFNDVQTRRSERKKENEILRQMQKAVQADTTAMRILQTVNNDVSRRMSHLLDTARYETSPGAKSVKNFAYINVSWEFIPDMAAFQNLQHEGLTLVEDQDARLSIIRYYDHIQQQRNFILAVFDGHFEKLTPYIIDEFVNFEREVQAVPEDFAKLKSDKHFWKLVARTKMFCDITSGQLGGRIEEARNFLGVLEKEVAKY
jgi:hypothetical protein